MNNTELNKGILFSSRATTGREGKYVSRHMCIIKSQCGVIDHLNSNDTQHTKINIEKYSNLKINSSENLYGDFYLEEGRKMSSWEEVYKNIDVTPLKKYNYLYLFAGIDLPSSGMTRFGNRVGVFPKDRGQIKFVSHGKLFVNVLALLKAHREYEIPIHEYQYDTGEIALPLFHEDYRPEPAKYASYYNHDVPEYGIQRMDSLQYYLADQRSRNTLFSVDKDIDFTFAYTVLKTSNRQDFPQFVDGVASKFKNSKVYTKNYFTGVDTSIDSDLYTDLITRTRFTLILPAYDRKSFAIDRFLTSLNADCLPLLHKDGNMNIMESSYGVSLDKLVISHPDDVKKYTEDYRLELLEYYKDKFLKVEKGLATFE